jgi:hypothetical protein
MSFSTSHTNVMSVENITPEQLGTAPTDRHLAQFNAGREVAGTLMGSGVVGAGPFSISISGHAGGDEPQGGDSVSVHVMKMYSPVAAT